MLLAEDDDVVKASSPHRSDQPLRAHFAKAIELRSGGVVCPWL
jgi:hypothetical protein